MPDSLHGMAYLLLYGMADTNRLHSINTSRILRTIWLNPGISRIKAAELLDLDRSTVTKIMQVILDRNLVLTAGKNTGQTGVGRRQISLKINQDLGAVLGLEVQDTRYSAVIASLSGKVLHSFDGMFRVSRENLVPHIVDLIARAKALAADSNTPLLGIGLGLPGIIDPYSGMIMRSNSLGIESPFMLREELIRAVREPVFIENDANCCCWGELAFRQENRSRNFIAVLGEFRDYAPGCEHLHGLAIGTGLAVRERVLHGDHFTAGEFRTVYASPQTGQFTIPYPELKRLPDDADVLDRVYVELARNLAFLVNCVDLTKVVFTGDLPAHKGRLKELLEQAIAENWIYDMDRNLIVEFSADGTRSVCIGAAGLVVEKFFSVPDVVDRFHEQVGYDLFEHIMNQGIL
jgi:predicted NBD/HSP70 family sugar kinase